MKFMSILFNCLTEMIGVFVAMGSGKRKKDYVGIFIRGRVFYIYYCLFVYFYLFRYLVSYLFVYYVLFVYLLFI